MFQKFFAFLDRVFGRLSPDQPKQQATEQYPIAHAWPFPYDRPEDTDFLIGQLIRGVVPEGEHVYYYWNGHKSRNIQTPDGKLILARHIVWWMEGRLHPETANGVTTKCGDPQCIKISHLILHLNQPKILPENKKRQIPSATFIPKSQQPPQPTGPADNTSDEPKFEKGDRSRCWTRKVHFESKSQAKKKAEILNDPKIRKRGRKVYPYDCPHCDGFHLTKINPKNFNPKKIGSW